MYQNIKNDSVGIAKTVINPGKSYQNALQKAHSLINPVQTKIRLEQAEAGRSPALLALRFATGVLRILRGYS